MSWGRKAAALVVVTGMFAAGCGDDGDSTAGGGGGDERPKVYVLLPSLESDSYVRESNGAEAAAATVDADVTVDAGSSRGEATNLMSKIDTAVTKGYDVIALNPGAVAAELKPALAEAAAQGVKIVAFDQGIPDFGDLSAFVGYDGHQAGLLRGQYMKEQLPDGGDVGMIHCFKENPLTASITEGQVEGMEGGGLEVVSELEGQCDPAKSRTAAENMLTANPELKGLLTGTDIAAMAALPAIRKFGKPLVVVGGDAQQDVLKVIADGGPIQATTTFPFEELGQQAVETAVKVANGEQVDAEILVQPKLVTKDNVAEIQAELERAANG